VPDETGVPEHWHTLLTPEERERSARKHFAVDARRSLTSRACLRLLLASYLECAPLQITIGVTPNGKPVLGEAHKNHRIEFNLSHSSDWIVLGFSRAIPLGIDIEWCRELEFDELVAGFFSPIERNAWATLPAANRRETFFTAWTRKEAYLKALGVGLSKSLDSFAVTMDPAATSQVEWCADNPQAAKYWRILSLDPAPGYAAAISVDFSVQRLLTFTFRY
jgi:4'-phosphopantetheinyl transferase